MGKAIKALCYGCVWVREERVMHNLCTLEVKDQICFCLYYALYFVNKAEIMEQYGKDTGLGGLEWVDIFDQGYRRSQWMANEGWFDDMTAQVIDKKEISVSSTSTMSSSSTSIDHSLPGLLEWMTNRPSKDWVLLVVGLASSHRLSPNGGRTKAHVKSPPNDWFHVVAGQCSPSDWVHVVAGQIFISEVLPVIEFMWWWKDSIFPAIEFVWWQDKLGTICNLTISMSHCLSICIRDGLLRLWNRVIKCKMVIMGWRLVSQTPGSLPLWHYAVRQFGQVSYSTMKKKWRA